MTSGTDANKNASTVALKGIRPTPPKLAAVSYLNMLPFFAELPSCELLPSPQSLNAQANQYDAYCSSLIAGLKSGKQPLSTTFGVFSSGLAMSVFVEPTLHGENHNSFWAQLSELWAHQHPSPVAALAHTETHGTIILRTTGESAQSVWMFEVLCALAGFKVEVLKDDTPAKLNSRGKPFPEARLFIGDQALWQLKNAPHTLRMDLGEIWTRHTGRRAWFAAWFRGTNEHSLNSTELDQILLTQIQTWKNESEFARWCKCFKFLEQRNNYITAATAEELGELRETLADYFNCLEHNIAAHEGKELLEFYVALNATFEIWLKAQGEHQEKIPTLPSVSASERIHLANT